MSKKLVFPVHYYHKCFHSVLLFSAILPAIQKGSRRKSKIFPKDVQGSTKYHSSGRTGQGGGKKEKTNKNQQKRLDFATMVLPLGGFEVCKRSYVSAIWPFVVHHLNK